MKEEECVLSEWGRVLKLSGFGGDVLGLFFVLRDGFIFPRR